jgi:Zn-dependent peptidase ImmA (M78 family)/DNA-binding XRE family transcriptional regulator
MPRTVRAKVKPALLIWARESAGYTPGEAARRLNVAEEKLAAWETGSASPTIGQLQSMAAAYKRPLSVLYLQTVPRDFQVMRDFRRLPGSGIRRFSPELAQEIRIAQQRRELALELFAETGDKPTRFRLSATLEEDPDAIGERIRHALHITNNDRAEWRRNPDGYAAFNAWRAQIETLGVLVFQSARVSSEEVSGFAVAERVLPVIVITKSDTPPTRRTFSLLHEFAHLMLRLSGVSELDVDAARPPEDQKVEVFCNRVAAATLVPKEQFLAEELVALHGAGKDDWTDAIISTLARNYSVSREAIVRRLLTLQRTTKAFYERKRQQYAEEFRQQRSAERERARESGEQFFTNPSRDAISQIGRPLVQMILASYYQERLSLSDVSGYLGIRTRHVPRLEDLASIREL